LQNLENLLVLEHLELPAHQVLLDQDYPEVLVVSYLVVLVVLVVSYLEDLLALVVSYLAVL
jgi:ABC-type microcin C transport system permease subunit YejB